MREILFGVAVALVLTAFVFWRARSRRDDEFYRRWRRLPREERRRILRAINRGQALPDPNHAELAARYAAWQQRLVGAVPSGAWLHVALAGVVVVASIGTQRWIGLLFAAFYLAVGLGTRAARKHRRERLETAQRMNEAVSADWTSRAEERRPRR